MGSNTALSASVSMVLTTSRCSQSQIATSGKVGSNRPCGSRAVTSSRPSGLNPTSVTWTPVPLAEPPPPAGPVDHPHRRPVTRRPRRRAAGRQGSTPRRRARLGAEREPSLARPRPTPSPIRRRPPWRSARRRGSRRWRGRRRPTAVEKLVDGKTVSVRGLACGISGAERLGFLPFPGPRRSPSRPRCSRPTADRLG